ncbi:GreA/GreB family elongation factor [Cellulophaga tyrosinoxydans]|uniref:Regulator of nucleoside diphosphate kinase n=1 Tax=Cellulophaga tyrosinoxydans TaxID=504486 RepID=A0A1W1Z7V4_9FLAO|nr:GreA/GreB family elongation factor [Cellulophaga tyrosinoxydans]SMC44540.1 regulator of nucleoside diphosphate kinase [Cellulophaga tyrosinoxydans]|tara:strand:- start:431 stop:850 length:420 start_codon:yes stop_codon:yes gene_type:complete
MKYGNLTIEKTEYVLLKRFINLSGFQKDSTVKKSILKLAEELKHAIICDKNDMPKDVIRFNSIITIQTNTNWTKEFQLVLPTDSDIKSNKISILTPMGAAVIGYAEGDTILWDFPSGEQQLKVSKVQQKESQIDIDVLL